MKKTKDKLSLLKNSLKEVKNDLSKRIIPLIFEFVKLATSSVWLINTIGLERERETITFTLDTPSFDFKVVVYDFEGPIVYFDMDSPEKICFESFISKRVKNKLVKELNKVYDFYKQHSNEVVNMKKEVILKLFLR